MSHHAQLVRTEDFAAYTYSPPVNESATVVLHEKFGIDEARDLTSKAQLRPVNSTQQTFVIKTSFITHQAQNALLKLFEEPPADTAFILVVPPGFQLLPTLQSRIGSEEQLQAEVDGASEVWQSFASASSADRMKQIEVWHKDNDKDPQWLAQITSGIHSIPVEQVPVDALPVVQLVGERLQTHGASNKMLLEHLALALPLLK